MFASRASFSFAYRSHEYLSVAKEKFHAHLRIEMSESPPLATHHWSSSLHQSQHPPAPRREEVHARCTRAHTRARAYDILLVAYMLGQEEQRNMAWHGFVFLRRLERLALHPFSMKMYVRVHLTFKSCNFVRRL